MCCKTIWRQNLHIFVSFLFLLPSFCNFAPLDTAITSTSHYGKDLKLQRGRGRRCSKDSRLSSFLSFPQCCWEFFNLHPIPDEIFVVCWSNPPSALIHLPWSFHHSTSRHSKFSPSALSFSVEITTRKCSRLVLLNNTKTKDREEEVISEKYLVLCEESVMIVRRHCLIPNLAYFKQSPPSPFISTIAFSLYPFIQSSDLMIEFKTQATCSSGYR